VETVVLITRVHATKVSDIAKAANMSVGFGGYCIYGLNRINQLSKMIFKDMLAYTTKDNKDAVITVGIINNGKMTYEVYGENGIKLHQEEHIYEIGSITKTFTTSLQCI
jgi:CubicO group peptidase (beta-lactamase class C family)